MWTKERNLRGPLQDTCLLHGLTAAVVAAVGIGLLPRTVEGFALSAQNEPNQGGDSKETPKQPEPTPPGDAQGANRPGEPPNDPADMLRRAEETKKAKDAARKSRAGKPSSEKATSTPPRPIVNKPETAPGEGIPEGATEGGPVQEINLPAIPDTGQGSGPPEERQYSFSLKGGTFEQLLDLINRQTGLAIIGEKPQGKVPDFITDQVISFQEMLSRVRMLLFNYKPLEPFWLEYRKDHLRVVRVNDIQYMLGTDRMYASVEEFRAAQLPKEELAIVIYTPKNGSIADAHRFARFYVTDYFRFSPMEGTNSATIFALVRDIDRYLEMVEFFAGRGTDPRTLKAIHVEHISATDAMTKLQTLMDISGEKVPRAIAPGGGAKRGAAQEPNPLENIPEPEVSILPEDSLHRILVRAMPNRIQEIEELLPHIDLAPDEPVYDPVVIEVKFAVAQELLGTIQQILSTNPTAGAVAKPSAATKKSKKPTPGQPTPQPAPAAQSAPVKMEEIFMFVPPNQNSIIVMANEDDVARVRRLAAMFDVETEIGPLQIPVQHVDAMELINNVILVMLGEPAQVAGAPFKMAPDRSGAAIWYTGPEKDLARVKELLAVLDVAEAEAKVHTVELRYQKPSFVAQMLQSLESAEPGPTPPSVPAPAATKKGGKRTKPSVRIPGPSKFTTDDDSNRLYVLCTDDEWSHYSKIIEDLEMAAARTDPLVEKLPLQHITAEAAIDRLNTLLPPDEAAAKFKYAPTEGGILVIGATASQLEEMRTVLAALDKPIDIIERTFEIHFADPAEVEGALITLLSSRESTHMPRPKVRKSQKADEAAPVLSQAPTEDSAELTIARLGNKLIVRTSPGTMDRVAALIEQLDVAEGGSEMRTYSDFAPGVELQQVVDTLTGVFAGSFAPAVKGNKKNRAEGVESPQFISQPGGGKLIVIAETSLYPRIEQLLDVLRAGGPDSDPIVTQSVDLKHRTPSELLEGLDKLLAMKVRRLEVQGQLNEPIETAGAQEGKARKKNKPAGVVRVERERYHIEPDDGAKRLIIAAPQVVIDEAIALIAKLDTPTVASQDSVVRTVVLKNAEAAEMVRAIRDLVGSAPTGIGKKGAKKDTAASIDTSETPMTISEVPGGKAVVLRGAAEDVEQAIAWIDIVDQQSIVGRVIRVYDVKHADPKRLADVIMAAADTPDRAGPKKPAGKKKDGADEEEDEEFSLLVEKIGSEVYIQVDVLARTLIVAATQAKIAQIDQIVARFNKPPEEGGGIVAAEQSVPQFMYELKHKSAFSAVLDLEFLLENTWQPSNELPKVKEAGIGEILVIRYPDETRFDEIRRLIAEHVDKPNPEDVKAKTQIFVPPPELNPLQAAEWLKVHFPNLDIEIVMPQVKPKDDFGIEQIKPLKPQKQAAAHPCVLPLALARSVAVFSLAATQPPDEEQPDDEELEAALEAERQQQLLRAAMNVQMTGGVSPDKDETAEKTDEPAKKAKSSVTGKVKIVVDPDKGVIAVEAPKGILEDIEDGWKDLEKQIEDLPEKPDIRIYGVRYIDVDTAAEILNEVFNTPRAQQAQMQQQNAMMQRMQQLAQARAGQQGNQQQPGGKGQDGGQPQPNQPGGRGAAAQQMPQMPFMQPSAPSSVRVVPNPRDRTLILRANTSQYPEILELLATIDQPKPIDSELKVFPLDKLNAVEVETLLKDMLGLDQASEGRARRGAAGGMAGMGGGVSAGGATLPRPIEAQPITDRLPLTVDPKDIKITSNEESNAIMVMAPREAIQYIGDLIQQLESQDIPDRITKHYLLEHAEVSEVTDYLTAQFAEAKTAIRGARRKNAAAVADQAQKTVSGAGNAPTFIAYTRLNLLSVQATEKQIAEIDTLVAQLDVSPPEEEWHEIRLAYADGTAVAETLAAMFGGESTTPAAAERRTKGGTGGTGPKFIADPHGRSVLFKAPISMHVPIQAAVAKIEEQSKDVSTVRIIELKHAVASDVADAIDAAYGSGKRTGGAKSGKSGAGASVTSGRFTVTPSDGTKRLFVVADNDMFTKIESLATTMDKPKQMEVDFKIFPLKFANARAVHGQMTNLVKGYMSMQGGKASMEPFSVEVDDRANAMIVLGGPVVFAFVEKALASVDVAGATNPTGVFMTVLKNSQAAEVAGNINRLWAQKTAGQGETPPQVEANQATNALIVRGTMSQIDEIKKSVIEPLEQAPAQPVQSIKLQHANAEVVAESIKRIFDDRKAAGVGAGKNIAPAELTISITPDANTNELIVQASETNLALIKTRVAELDRPDVAGQTATSTKTYTIRYADPNTVANVISQWARARTTTPPSGRVAARDQVTALAEPTTQSVVVTANEANHKLIEQMIRDIDSDKAIAEKTTVVYPVKNADPNALVQAVNTAFRPETRGGRARPEDQVSASVESGTQAIIVTASAKNHDAVKTLIEKADVQPEADRRHQAHVVNLKNADPEAVSRTLNEIFVRTNTRPQGTQGPPISISAVTGSKALLVKCKDEDFTRIQEVVASLDSDETAAGEEVRVVPVLYGDATEMQMALQEYLKKPGQQSGRGTALTGDVRISVLAQGNAVVVSGEKEEVDNLEATIKRLDQATEKGSVPQIIPLKHANVSQLLPSVQEVFENPAGGTRRNATPPVIVADETLNALVVRAGPTDFAAIKGMVEQLDTEEQAARKNFRIIKVQPGMNLTKLAEDVEEAVNESASAQAPSGGRGSRQASSVVIKPNPQTRTLLVSGTPTLFDQVEDIIRAYENMGPSTGAITTSIFKLESITPEETQALIEHLTGEGASGGRGRAGSTGGSSGRPRSLPTPPRNRRPNQ